MGCAYTNGIVVLAEGLDMFRLGPIAAGGRMIPSGNLSFTKINLVGWMSGSWAQKDWDHFGCKPLRLWDGGPFWLKISATWGGGDYFG
jgi:hypothetical protein